MKMDGVDSCVLGPPHYFKLFLRNDDQNRLDLLCFDVCCKCL